VVNSLVTASPAVRNRFELSTAAVGVVSSISREEAAESGLFASSKDSTAAAQPNSPTEIEV
jgi:hypothetical protein